MQLFQTSVTHGGQYVMMMMRPNGILFLLLARALAPALLLISIKSDTLPRERPKKSFSLFPRAIYVGCRRFEAPANRAGL